MSLLLTFAAPLFAIAAVEAAPNAAEPLAAPIYGAPLPSTRLAAIAQDAVAEAPTWHGFLTLGATLTSGNTDIRTVAANAEAVLDRGEDRWTIRAYWNYGEEKDQATGDYNLTQRQAGASGKYDYFFSEKTYAYGTGSVQTDTIAGLDLRWTLGAGVGHLFLDEEDRTFSGEAGLSYVDESYVVSSDDASYLALRLAYDFFYQISETTSFRQITEVFPSLESSDDIYAKVDSSVSVQLTENMIGKLQHVMDYDNTPASGADRLDHRVILTVGWTF
ncbi:MAG: DUF481 domain-containing protein [Planctomycetota bacterium]